MRQICNLVYADLRRGRNKPQIAELEATLAPPEEKEAARARVNQQVLAEMTHGMLPPPPRKK